MSKITLIYLHPSGMPHTIGKFSMNATTLSQSKVYTKSYGPPNSRESQFKKFQDTNLVIPKQNNIWVLAPWLSTKNTIRGKVVASPKSRMWWILWIYVCLWLVRAQKVLQLCTNQLIVWFVQVHVNNWPTCHSS
jgi:hypothetical protein